MRQLFQFLLTAVLMAVALSKPAYSQESAVASMGGARISNAAAQQSAETRQSVLSNKEVQQQQVVVSTAGARPDGGSEFQKFISETTGTSLPSFGAEFFSNAPTTFAPLQHTPVPNDYQLGPGDEVLIRGWGSIDIDYRATLDRNGLITVPTLGAIVLSGVKVKDVQGVISGAIARIYKGVTVNVTFGQLRAMTIYVVGQARRPGTYTVSSLSTLVTALFASGGPNSNGSMRRIQIKRGGMVAAELDLYDFIAKGDKSADVKLQDGDTIFIPPAIGHIALVGKVNMPAIYELRTPTETIDTLLAYGGGMPIVADPHRAFLERIDPQLRQPRLIEQFALDGAGLKRSLKNGDILNVTSITPEFSNIVTLRGNVDQAIRAPYKEGMRVGDLIPSREYLVTRSSLSRKNNAVNSAGLTPMIGGAGDEINWDYAVIERLGRTDLSVSLVAFNLGKMLADPAGPDNLKLERGDVVTIFSQADVRVPRDKRRIFVRVEGEVNVPGVYQI